MPGFPAAHRLVAVLALSSGFALVGVAAGGVRAVDADLERATLQQQQLRSVCVDRDTEL